VDPEATPLQLIDEAVSGRGIRRHGRSHCDDDGYAVITRPFVLLLIVLNICCLTT